MINLRDARITDGLPRIVAEQPWAQVLSAVYGNDNFWANNAANERCPLRGGSWGNGGSAGVFGLDLNNPRSNSWTAGGGRSAFVKLPAEA